MSHTAKQAAQRGMLAGTETKWKDALVLLVNGTWKRELFSMTVEKRLGTGSWRVVRSLIQLLMVMENRPADPGSIQGSHRRISFIRINIEHARTIFCVKLSINNHIVGLVRKKHIIRTRLMYHAACKVEFQPFKRLYSQLTFFNFL